MVLQLKTWRAELHVHTVLSPCADVEMIPPLIVQQALEKGINLIAITDHNASANVLSVQKAALHTELTVLPGMELQTHEEVHVLCLFDHLDQLMAFQEIVDRSLPPTKNRPDFFGEQFVVDETGDFIRREERLLLTSTSLNLKDAWQIVTQLGGFLIPAHVNRKAFGLFEVLGFIPEDLPVELLEISRHLAKEDAVRKYPQINGYPFIQSGDVHRLEEFLGVNQFTIEAPNIAEIRKAAQSQGERSLSILY